MRMIFFPQARLLFLFSALLVSIPVHAQRQFVHPGISYTQSDLDRMKAMIEARREPYYSTYLALVSSGYSAPGNATYGEITQIAEGQFNNTIGADGRRAHDLALLYHLTGKEVYAKDAVARLNRYNNLTNASSRGTAPLDNGKIYLLMEAAELLRDYGGWQSADQEAFRAMLTHPFYSTTTTPTGHWSSTDASNDVTFYWNIWNFDPSRYGNQGLFAARGMMAMGIYLDNDTIYDRAYRYLMNLSHRPDDMPYQSGPPVRTTVSSESATQYTYNFYWTDTEPDFHSDETLLYYIYQNGQSQESARDQDHVMAGIGNYTAIGEIAWSQGDTLYNSLGYRILQGIEYNTRYNLSYVQTFPDQSTAWEPAGSSKTEGECTFDNGLFYQAISRSARWEAKAISSTGRGSGLGSSGWRAQALAHYKMRMGLASSQFKWLERSYDHLIANYGVENWGTSSWFYEWNGWGTLTKQRSSPWMAGDAGKFVNGTRVSGMPKAPCTLSAVDYDYFAGNGEGRTFHNLGTARSTLYRTDGTIEIEQDDSAYAISGMKAGEWMNYSVVFPAGEGNAQQAPVRRYNIYATYKASKSGARLFAAVDDGSKKGKDLAIAGAWTERLLGTFDVVCGAATLRILVRGKDDILKLKNIRIEPIDTPSLQKVKLDSLATIRVYNTSNEDVSSQYQASIAKSLDGNHGETIGLGSQKYLVFDFGEQGLDIGRLSLYNNGVAQDTREMGTVLGSTAGGVFPSAWDNGQSQTILRTNGTLQGLAVPILENSWSNAGVIGKYTVGPVGKYRYLAFHNWSTLFNASDIEVQTIALSRIHEPDTEPSADWNEPDVPVMRIESDAKQSRRILMEVRGNLVVVQNAERIEVYSLHGERMRSVAGDQVTLPRGVYLIKSYRGSHSQTAKVCISAGNGELR